MQVHEEQTIFLVIVMTLWKTQWWHNPHRLYCVRVWNTAHAVTALRWGPIPYRSDGKRFVLKKNLLQPQNVLLGGHKMVPKPTNCKQPLGYCIPCMCRREGEWWRELFPLHDENCFLSATIHCFSTKEPCINVYGVLFYLPLHNHCTKGLLSRGFSLVRLPSSVSATISSLCYIQEQTEDH